MRKKNVLLIGAVSMVWVARATVEPSCRVKVLNAVKNERVVGEKQTASLMILKELKCGIPEIDTITHELRNRFQGNNFGRPPRMLGRKDLVRANQTRVKRKK